MKKTILISVIILACFINSRLMSNSTGAIKATGAPGEGTCTQCHGGSVNSDASGSASFSVAGNPTHYVPGQSYLVSITTSYHGRSRFGFAISAKDANNEDVGTFSKNGNNNVQVVTDYVTHTSAGTSASNTKTWTFQWTAPAISVNDVTFFICGMAANNNGTDDPGDKIYTQEMVLPASINAGISDITEASSYSVYPNPVANSLNLAYTVKSTGNLAITLMNTAGKTIDVLMNETVTKGHYDSRFELENKPEKGIYFLRIESANGTTVKKILIL